MAEASNSESSNNNNNNDDDDDSDNNYLARLFAIAGCLARARFAKIRGFFVESVVLLRPGWLLQVSGLKI